MIIIHSIIESSNVEIENRIDVTVVFPDNSMPQPTNGGFATQEEFRKWMMGKQDGKWSSEVHSRPLADQVQDHKDDSIADAFPLLFPYGYTGLPNDPAVVELSERKPKAPKRQRLSVFQKYLQHRSPSFHHPLFNLIVENITMKETIFQKTKMFCNLKYNDNSTMGHRYGAMKAHELERAIQDARN